MHHPVWIEGRTLRLPGDTTAVELNAHPLFCTIQRTKRVRLTFPSVKKIGKLDLAFLVIALCFESFLGKMTVKS